MHYHAEIWVPESFDAEKQVERIMAPYSGEINNYGFWDWWQIGGRWTGAHTPDYNPEEDPRNHEVCWICKGTGFRTDELGQQAREDSPTYTCNNCGHFNEETKEWEHGPQGKGVTVKWPTQWALHEGDIIPVSAIGDDLACHTLIVRGDIFHKEEWTGKEIVKTDFDGRVKAKLNELGIADGYLVTVDYHN